MLPGQVMPQGGMNHGGFVMQGGGHFPFQQSGLFPYQQGGGQFPFQQSGQIPYRQGGGQFLGGQAYSGGLAYSGNDQRQFSSPLSNTSSIHNSGFSNSTIVSEDYTKVENYLIVNDCKVNVSNFQMNSNRYGFQSIVCSKAFSLKSGVVYQPETLFQFDRVSTNDVTKLCLRYNGNEMSTSIENFTFQAENGASPTRFTNVLDTPPS